MKPQINIRPHDQLACNRLDDLHDPVPRIVLLPNAHEAELGQFLHVSGNRSAIAALLRRFRSFHFVLKRP
jgi:hypothetical protein